MALPAIGAIIYSIFLLTKLLLKNKSSKDHVQLIDGIEIVLPAFGVILFTFFLGIKSISELETKRETKTGDINILLANTGDVVSYPSLSDSLNTQIKEHTFYMEFNFMGIYFKNYLNGNFNSQDFLDAVEYVFLDKMMYGWIIPRPDDPIFTEKLFAPEIVSRFKQNKLFLVTEEELKTANSKVGFEQKKFTYLQEFLNPAEGVRYILLPENTKIKNSRTDIARVIEFQNDIVKFNFILLHVGESNFRPEYNAFHLYLTRFTPDNIPRSSRVIKMKNVIVTFNYEFAPYAALRRDYDTYLSLMRSIETNLSNQVYWDPLRKTLETEYLLTR